MLRNARYDVSRPQQCHRVQCTKYEQHSTIEQTKSMRTQNRVSRNTNSASSITRHYDDCYSCEILVCHANITRQNINFIIYCFASICWWCLVQCRSYFDTHWQYGHSTHEKVEKVYNFPLKVCCTHLTSTAKIHCLTRLVLASNRRLFNLCNLIENFTIQSILR